jgi:SAM-dependent methyltransferase
MRLVFRALPGSGWHSQRLGVGGPAGASAPRRTPEAFGYLWSQPFSASAERRPYHFEWMRTALHFDAPRGLVMDAGCGDGIDLVSHARRAGVAVIGVELSEAGCRTSIARIKAAANTHVVQRLPFADGIFDSVYSYAVLHHVASPTAAAQEIARVPRLGGTVAIYLYEDFGGRDRAWRLALAPSTAAAALPYACHRGSCSRSAGSRRPSSIFSARFPISCFGHYRASGGWRLEDRFGMGRDHFDSQVISTTGFPLRLKSRTVTMPRRTCSGGLALRLTQSRTNVAGWWPAASRPSNARSSNGAVRERHLRD